MCLISAHNIIKNIYCQVIIRLNHLNWDHPWKKLTWKYWKVKFLPDTVSSLQLTNYQAVEARAVAVRCLWRRGWLLFSLRRCWDVEFGCSQHSYKLVRSPSGQLMEWSRYLLVSGLLLFTSLYCSGNLVFKRKTVKEVGLLRLPFGGDKYRI